jgi:uncharacterized membrane protein YidH (DUF202 family)
MSWRALGNRFILALVGGGEGKMSVPTEVHERADLRDYLAAERTFLAWVRTGLALMGFGIVVARFGLFLQQVRLFDNTLSLHLTACRCGSEPRSYR